LSRSLERSSRLGRPLRSLGVVFGWGFQAFGGFGPGVGVGGFRGGFAIAGEEAGEAEGEGQAGEEDYQEDGKQ